MTNVLLENVKDVLETEELESNYQITKIDKIYTLLKLKSIAKQFKKDINKNIEKNSKVRNGKMVIKGTRITTKELLLIMAEYSKKEENDKDIIEYVRKQYPSIDSDEKILYGALYEISKINTFTFIVGVLIKYDKNINR